MAEAAPQNAPVTPTPSPDPVNPSGDEPKAPAPAAETPVPSQPDGDIGTQGDGGEEPPAPATPAPKPLDQWTLADLDAKASKEALSGAEIARRDALRDDQRNRDFQRQRDIARVESARQQAVVAKTEAIMKAPDGFIEDAKTVLTQFGYEALPDAALELLKTRFERRTGQVFDDSASAPLVESARMDTRELLVERGIQVTPTVERNLGQMTLTELFELHREFGRMDAKAEGPAPSSDPVLPKDHVAVPKDQWDEYQKAKQNEESASTPDKVPPSSQRSVPAGGRLTRASFMAMTPQQRAQVTRERPDEVEAL